jgi:putative photosynthetic complex assembly protein 2
VAEHGLPVLYALFLWWFSTGLILYLDGLPRRSFRWSMLVATGLLGAALYHYPATFGLADRSYPSDARGGGA